jgi:hypothetical protein
MAGTKFDRNAPHARSSLTPRFCARYHAALIRFQAIDPAISPAATTIVRPRTRDSYNHGLLKATTDVKRFCEKLGEIR